MTSRKGDECLLVLCKSPSATSVVPHPLIASSGAFSRPVQLSSPLWLVPSPTPRFLHSIYCPSCLHYSFDLNFTEFGLVRTDDCPFEHFLEIMLEPAGAIFWFANLLLDYYLALSALYRSDQPPTESEIVLSIYCPNEA